MRPILLSHVRAQRKKKTVATSLFLESEEENCAQSATVAARGGKGSRGGRGAAGGRRGGGKDGSRSVHSSGSGGLQLQAKTASSGHKPDSDSDPEVHEFWASRQKQQLHQPAGTTMAVSNSGTSHSSAQPPARPAKRKLGLAVPDWTSGSRVFKDDEWCD